MLIYEIAGQPATLNRRVTPIHFLPVPIFQAQFRVEGCGSDGSDGRFYLDTVCSTLTERWTARWPDTTAAGSAAAGRAVCTASSRPDRRTPCTGAGWRDRRGRTTFRDNSSALYKRQDKTKISSFHSIPFLHFFASADSTSLFLITLNH